MTLRVVSSKRRRACSLLLALTPSLAPACKSAAEWREDADRQVYALVDSRRAELFTAANGFTIEPPPESLRQRILSGEGGEVQLTLVECLNVASENSRDYQTRKERLYLSALDLTAERWRFEARGFGTLSANVIGTGDHSDLVTVSGDVGVTQLLKNGGSIVASIGSSLFRALATGDGWDALSALSFSFTQPLLSGSGRLVAQENLTQAERNLVYEVRSFERFRRTFAFDVASRYYSLLEAYEQLENQRRNLENLVTLVDRNEALAAAGRISDIEVDQARQNELDSENEVLEQESDLQRRLDDFKLFLGLPVDAALQLDSAEFTRLTEEDPLLDALSVDLATRIALAERLDLLNVEGSVEDSRRRVEITADDLRMALDLSVDSNVASIEGRPTDLPLDASIWSAGFDLELPFDKLDERNAYRSSLIDLASSERELDLTADQIESDVRDSLRTAATTRESYAIQQGAVVLAERRVASAELSLLAGRASTRDLLESQDDLLAAQNSQTTALIDFTLTRLGLYLNLEMLRVSEQGIEVDQSPLSESTTESTEEQP